ncbi:hypothetical protein GWK47_011819 [Chionoecetes opilio]|uniref:Peptidase A2 domain-containing protein n=1 Tax=Chionoecetes opilio TaxID=41210 RepID=A0A8J4XY76_CHIOP|nr:hypothetical protein GWK47_011819 [Chionoecetes opilio]
MASEKPAGFSEEDGARMPSVEKDGDSGDEQKPDVMTLLTAMMGKMNAQAVQAREAEERERVQAREAEERTRELRVAMHEGWQAVQRESQQYTDEKLDIVKEELLGAVELVRRQAEEAAAVALRGVTECRAVTSHQPCYSQPSRRKPADFDGKVPWEAYKAQFEILADAQLWSVEERVLQLVSSLRGAAVEVLGHLTPAQRASYQCVVDALQRKFGHHQQAEVYRAHLKGRVRMRGEPLSHLAHELESLVRRAYPKAPEEMVVVLARDHFVDALIDQRLQIYVKQAHPEDVQVALARALEFESFLHQDAAQAEESEYRCFQGKLLGMWPDRSQAGPVWAGGNDAIVGRAAPSHLPALLLELWPAGPRNQHLQTTKGRATSGKRGRAGCEGRDPAITPRAPRGLSCRHVTPPAVQVAGTVDGRPCRLVVDTGAERTFAREDVVDSKDPSVAQQQLCGVTGHCVSLKGPVKARIGVGSVEEELPVFVAAMEEPCLLGMDYLSQCEALVDFGRQTLRVRGEEVPLVPVSAAESFINPEVKHAALWTGNRVQCMLSREGQESDVTTTGGEQRQDGGVMSEQPGSGGAAVTGLPEYLEDLARRSAVCLTEAQTPPGRAWLHTL